MTAPYFILVNLFNRYTCRKKYMFWRDFAPMSDFLRNHAKEKHGNCEQWTRRIPDHHSIANNQHWRTKCRAFCSCVWSGHVGSSCRSWGHRLLFVERLRFHIGSLRSCGWPPVKSIGSLRKLHLQSEHSWHADCANEDGAHPFATYLEDLWYSGTIWEDWNHAWNEMWQGKERRVDVGARTACWAGESTSSIGY